MSKESDQRRYMAAAHAMQTGVAMDLERGSDSGSPKHLRVGVNSAMVETGTIVKLLIAKGIIDEEEWYASLADMMEDEVESYRAKLGLPSNVSLG